MPKRAMEMSPLVTVVMPVYNGEQHIAESIDSVLGQTFTNWELVVIDDGSTDRTAEVVSRYEDPRVRYLRQDNGGQAAARNTGIRNSKAPVVAFLDADDLWLPEKLARQLEVLRTTDSDLVYSDGYVIYDDGSPASADFFAIVPGATDGATMERLLYAYNRIATLSVIVKRSALERAGLFDECRSIQNCEDYELWLRLARAGCSFYGMAEKLMRYRRHSASATQRQSRLLKPSIEVVKKHADCVKQTEARRRIRGLYRELITTLISEGDLAGARNTMREFSAWDRGAPITTCQRILLRLAPNSFGSISRQCLYRLEWHLTHFMDRLGAS